MNPTTPEIPAAPQVTGASEGDSNIIKRALELALGTYPEPPEPLQRAMTSINSALPALPTKLLHRIWAGEYIDFGDLPPARSKPRSLPHYLQGQVLVLQMQELEGNCKRAIPDFTTWAQCFALYTAAILMRQPERAPDLMAYLFMTTNNARRYRWPSWLVYDQNFRQLMADTRDNVWAKTNPEIFTHCFINAQKSQESWCKICHSVEHTSGLCPSAPPTRSSRPRQDPPPPDPKRNTICKDFNNKEKGCRWGTNCFRRHICSICRGSHPKSKCRAKGEDTPTSSNRD